MNHLKDSIETNSKVTPFQFKVSAEDLEKILYRVASYPWHEMPDDGGWDYGTNMDYLKELCNLAFWDLRIILYLLQF